MAREQGAPHISSLMALGHIAPAGGLVERPEIQELEAWLRDPQGSLLWVHGRPGSGRTTAVAAALRRSMDSVRAARRVGLAGVGSLEEFLEEVKNFLSQLGDRALAQVLDQRAFLWAKITILFQALRRHRVVLWLDDFDALEVALAEAGRGREPLDFFLEQARSLAGSGSRVVVVSSMAPPTSDFRAIEFGALPESGAAELWQRMGGPGKWSERAAASDLGRDPFTVGLLARLAARLSSAEVEALVSKSPRLAEAAIAVALGHLSPQASALLEALAVLPPEPTRGLLRQVATAVDGDSPTRSPSEHALLEEIEGWGLIQVSRGRSNDEPVVVVPVRVRRLVEAGLRRRDPDRWVALNYGVGNYYMSLAGRSANLWHLLVAWRRFILAGLHAEAYELQKSFLQEFLGRGYIDLARSVLEDTARTTHGAAKAVALGNLAITYKNTGQHDRALETYEKVRVEFETLGDLPNVARVLHQLGNTHYVRADYAAALSSYRRSLELSSEIGDRTVTVATRIQIANSLYQMREIGEALAEYEGAIEETRALGAHALTAAVALQLSQIHLQSARYLEAEGSLAEAESCARESGDLRTVLKVLEAQGVLARERREYDLARERFEEARHTADALGDGGEVAVALVLEGDLERTRLQLADALGCYLRAKECLLGLRSQGEAASADFREVLGRVEERMRSLAETVGPEAYERVLRRASVSPARSSAPHSRDSTQGAA